MAYVPFPVQPSRFIYTIFLSRKIKLPLFQEALLILDVSEESYNPAEVWGRWLRTKIPCNGLYPLVSYSMLRKELMQVLLDCLGCSSSCLYPLASLPFYIFWVQSFRSCPLPHRCIVSRFSRDLSYFIKSVGTGNSIHFEALHVLAWRSMRHLPFIFVLHSPCAVRRFNDEPLKRELRSGIRQSRGLECGS